jgi:hypothetical protein
MTIPFEVDTNFLSTHTESMLGDLSMNGAFARADPSPALRDQTYVTIEDNRDVLPNSLPLASLSSGILSNTTGTGILNPRTITGTDNEITVNNGNGVSGNPTLSLSATLVLPGTLTSTENVTLNNNGTVNATLEVNRLSYFNLAASFNNAIHLTSSVSEITASSAWNIKLRNEDVTKPIQLIANTVEITEALARRTQTNNNITFGNATQTFNIGGSSVFGIEATGVTVDGYLYNPGKTGYILQTANKTTIANDSQILADFSSNLNGGISLRVASYFYDAVTFEASAPHSAGGYSLTGPIFYGAEPDTNITLDATTQTYNIGGNSIFDLSASGVRFGGSGARVTSISTDGTLASNSDTLASTQKAIKTYVDAAVGGFVSVTTSTQAMSANNTYFFTYAGQCLAAMPTVGAPAGSFLRLITGPSGNTFKTVQASGQAVYNGAQGGNRTTLTAGTSLSTTSGAMGYLQSVDPNTVVMLRCVVANTTWVVEYTQQYVDTQ